MFLLTYRYLHYQVVATFVIEREDELSIAEALSIIMDWNPNWKPRFMMTDYSRPELNAIKRMFGTYFFIHEQFIIKYFD